MKMSGHTEIERYADHLRRDAESADDGVAVGLLRAADGLSDLIAASAPEGDDLTERLAGVVADMLSRFGGQGPNSQHSGWVSERTLAAWRSVYREWADQVAPEGREADSD